MKLDKVTKNTNEAHRRRYDDACGAAHALDLLGERWALLVVRELLFGPKRFGDLRAGLPGISANVLTQRLAGLEAIGIVLRRRLPPPASSQVYELTSWGYESEPIFQALGRWAARSPSHDPTRPLSSVSLLMSLRTMLDPKRAEGIDARIGFRFGQEGFVARLDQDGIAITREPPDTVDLLFAGPPTILAAILYGGQPIDALIAAGLLTVEGDRALADRFVTLFPLPPKEV